MPWAPSRRGASSSARTAAARRSPQPLGEEELGRVAMMVVEAGLPVRRKDDRADATARRRGNGSNFLPQLPAAGPRVEAKDPRHDGRVARLRFVGAAHVEPGRPRSIGRAPRPAGFPRPCAARPHPAGRDSTIRHHPRRTDTARRRKGSAAELPPVSRGGACRSVPGPRRAWGDGAPPRHEEDLPAVGKEARDSAALHPGYGNRHGLPGSGRHERQPVVGWDQDVLAVRARRLPPPNSPSRFGAEPSLRRRYSMGRAWPPAIPASTKITSSPEAEAEVRIERSKFERLRSRVSPDTLSKTSALSTTRPRRTLPPAEMSKTTKSPARGTMRRSRSASVIPRTWVVPRSTAPYQISPEGGDQATLGASPVDLLRAARAVTDMEVRTGVREQHAVSARRNPNVVEPGPISKEHGADRILDAALAFEDA